MNELIMDVNFKIDDNIGVYYNDSHIDLHNNFELDVIKEIGKDIAIEFLKRNADWVHKDEFDRLTFLHKNVSYKFFDNGNNDEFPEDENTLSVIGYFPKSMRDINYGHMERSTPELNDDIIYIFQNEKTIRIECSKIELSAIKNKK